MSMYFNLRRIVPVCLLCGSFLFTQKSYAFDYEKYNSERKQLRSLAPLTPSAASSHSNQEEKSGIMKEFVTKLLDAMQSDAVPARLFDTNTDISIYFKPAKISKVGITYKF